MGMSIVIWGIASVVCAFIGAFVAKRKNRSADVWAFICFLLPPLLLILIFLPRSKTGPRRPGLTRGDINDLREDFLD